MLCVSKSCMNKSTDAVTAPSYDRIIKDSVKTASFFGYMRFFAEIIAYCFYYFYNSFKRFADGLGSQIIAG